MPSPPYSPKLTPFFFISLDEKSPQRETFSNVEEVKQKKLNGIKINQFKNCFEQWKKCLNRYIAENGEYFVAEV